MVSRSVPSAKTPMMARSTAARRCAVSADSGLPPRLRPGSRRISWTRARAWRSGYWPAWGPGPGCPSPHGLGDRRLAGGVVGLLHAGGEEMGDGGAGLLDAGVSGLMQGSESDTLMMPKGATGKSRGCQGNGRNGVGKLIVTIGVGNQQGEQLEDLEVTVDIGWTMVRLEGNTIATQVNFAEEGEPPLLGMVTLEEALLAVDPVGQRLIPVDVERLQTAGRTTYSADAEPPFGYPEPRCPQIQRGHDPVGAEASHSRRSGMGTFRSEQPERNT